MNEVRSESDVVAGAVLAGKYRVERLLGQGGMGVVVEARHTQLDDRVALKFLLPEYSANPDASARFLREARAAVKIKSPHVARVSDVGTLENGAPYMVMEYLDGADASHALGEGQVLPLTEAIDYIVQTCDAIADAHSQGIVHRDLKPANLFVTRHADGTPFVKVLDFGISKVLGDGGVDNLTRTSATMGSALYMSPEQIRQSKSVDHRTDIYALGVTLYELLTGRQPFIADSFAALCVEVATGAPTPLTELRPDVPPEFAAALGHAYARDPAQRYQNVAQMVVALSPWAPPRSQPIIERLARAAGLVARANEPPGHASFATPGAVPARTAGVVTGSTHMNAALTDPGLPRQSSLAPLVAVIAGLGFFAAVGIGAFVFLRHPAVSAEPVPSGAPASLPVIAAPPPQATAAEETPQPPAAPSELPAKPEAKVALQKPAKPGAKTAEPASKPAEPKTVEVKPTPPATKPKDIEGMR